uniref:ARAD1D34320p n=1 Tax=Blastobotrys adeninivorans TaxID=409370 RepID=A0A060THV1_BLAAD
MSLDPRFPPIVQSDAQGWLDFLDDIKNAFTSSWTNKVCGDLVALSCGCLAGESEVANQIKDSTAPIRCLNCQNQTIIVSRLEPFRKIIDKVPDQQQTLAEWVLSANTLGTPPMAAPENTNDIDLAHTNLDYDYVPIPRTSSHGHPASSGLLGLFRSAAQSIVGTSPDSTKDWMDSLSLVDTQTNSVLSKSPSVASTLSGVGPSGVQAPTPLTSLAPLSPSSTSGISIPSTSGQGQGQTQVQGQTAPHPNQSPATQFFYLPPSMPPRREEEDGTRESNYAKCFPGFRKQFQHSTQQRSLMQRNKKSYSTAISPDATKFALVNAQKFQIYSIPNDYNDPPTLICEPSIQDWGSSPMVSVSTSLVAIASSSGDLWVYNFEGKLQYHNKSQFTIHCMTISPLDTMVACGIVTRDKTANIDKQPLVVLHFLTPNQPHSTSTTSQTTQGPISLLIPYYDTINYLCFAHDETYLGCSTSGESRFMVISLADRTMPRLVMKSIRRVDANKDSEGITSVKFIPRHLRRQYMVVTSSVMSSNSPPVILDPKINTNSGTSASSAVSQPSLIMRVDKVGSQIHNCAVSPRGDAIAFLDRSGLVYVMHAPGMLSDHRRIAVVEEVSRGPQYTSAASMQFTSSGHALVIVDRKGELFIEDYGAGLPNQAGIGKCRLLA